MAGPIPPSHIRQWLGHSIGHWEGDTLVVDTTNFSTGTSFYGSSENLHLVERYTRAGADLVMYEVTVEDPSVWVSPWTVEIPLDPGGQPVQPDLRGRLPRGQLRHGQHPGPARATLEAQGALGAAWRDFRADRIRAPGS